MTSKSYQELLVYAKPNNTNIKRGRVVLNKSFSSLWPSETATFQAALDSKLKLMAQRFGNNFGTEEQTKQKTQIVQQVNPSRGSQEEIRAALGTVHIRAEIHAKQFNKLKSVAKDIAIHRNVCNKLMQHDFW